MPALRLSDFTHFSITLEGRFETAFLMWDRSGEVTQELSKLSASLKVSNATPQSVVLSLKDKYDAGYSMQNFTMTQYYPERDPAEFKEEIDKLSKVLIEKFELKELIRIGFRMIFVKEYVSEEAATNEFLSAELLKVPAKSTFNIEGRLAFPEYAIQRKDETHIVTARLKVQTDKVEFTIPRNVKGIEPVSREQSRIFLDFDYATMASTSVGGFRASLFVDEARHLINRDAHHFLGG